MLLVRQAVTMPRFGLDVPGLFASVLDLHVSALKTPADFSPAWGIYIKPCKWLQPLTRQSSFSASPIAWRELHPPVRPVEVPAIVPFG